MAKEELFMPQNYYFFFKYANYSYFFKPKYLRIPNIYSTFAV